MAVALGAASLASAQNWPIYGGDEGNQRYSQASQITPANVNKLTVKWALQLGTNRSQESTPILVGDTLYVTSSFGPKNVFAVNAKTGEVKWKYSPEMPKAIEQYACCDVNNRGVSYNDGKIFFGRLDSAVTALDAKSGKEIWTTKVVALENANTGVTCNAICPGWVLTPLVQKQVDARADREGISNDAAKHALVSEKQPSGEFVKPEQLAALAVFLCGPDASEVRGAAWNMDGGWTAQ